MRPHSAKSNAFLIIVGAVTAAAGLVTMRASARPGEPRTRGIPPGSAYRRYNIASDLPGLASLHDPLLINPWGITHRGTSPLWVAANGTSVSAVYQASPDSDVVVPFPTLPRITIPGGLPTGVVSNETVDFVLHSGNASGTAVFLFSSITGNIVGWNTNVPTPGSTVGVVAASHPGHVYTGLAIGNNGFGNLLYAADFANGTIDVYNATFVLQSAAVFPFADPTIPQTSGNTYHPFNIQAVGGSLIVTYAKVGLGGLAENGSGFGYVRKFNMNGVRDLTFGINNGALDAPWGVALAPVSFGIFGNALILGNFADNGRIHAFNPTTGAFLGTLQDEGGTPIEIDQLRGFVFGNGGNSGDPRALYFVAGLGDEEHGLFGLLRPTTETAATFFEFSSSNYPVNETAGQASITVIRSGDLSGTASVKYAALPVSQLQHAALANQVREGTLLASQDFTGGGSYERKPGGALGSTQDTGDNASNFIFRAASDPQNLGSPPVPLSSATSTGVLISEFRPTGPGSFHNRFVELYNNTAAPIAIGGWKLKGSDTYGVLSTLVTIAPGRILPARSHFLATGMAYNGAVPGDQPILGSTFFHGVALTTPNDTIVDQVGIDFGIWDVAIPPGTLTFGPGQAAKSFVVAVHNDTAVEGAETIDLALSNPTNAALIAPRDATLTISDNGNGSAAAKPAISMNDVAASEGNAGTKSFAFTVTLSAPTAFTTTVHFATADDSAVAPSDYVAASGELNFAPGATAVTLNIAVKGDPFDEPTETFRVNLSNAANATIADGQGVGVILDDGDTATPIPGGISNAGAVLVLLLALVLARVRGWSGHEPTREA